MMGMNGMDYGPHTQPGERPRVPPVAMTSETPVAYYQPIAITPGTIKWVAGLLVGGLVFLSGLPAAERYMRPAPQSEMDSLSKVVQILQQGQSETQKAVERLTIAVDNLSGIVAELKSASGKKMAVPTPKLR
jgi:hypothetical protein